MKDRIDERATRLGAALKRAHVDRVDVPVPSCKWRQDVLREVRLQEQRTDFTGLWGGRGIFVPVAQLACSALMLLGLLYVTDSSLATMDLNVFDANVVSAAESLVMNYEF